MPTTRKTPPKKSTATKRPNAAGEKNAQTRQKSGPQKQNPDRLIHQFMPYILAIAAVFLLISYFIADSTGFFGSLLKNIMFGLFSGGAWAIPALLLCLAVFWKRDAATNSLRFKIPFAILTLTFISVLVQAFSRNGESGIAETFNLIELWKSGCETVGGGAIGGLVGNLLLRGFGFAGTLILSIALILLFAIFLFGMTPHMFAVYIITGIREWRSGLRERMSDAKDERAQMVAEYEAKRAEQITIRQQQEMLRRQEQARKNPTPEKKPRRRTVNDALTEEYEPDVDITPVVPAEPVIDEAVFDEAMAEKNASIVEESDVVESDAPPFDVDEAPVEPPKKEVNLTFFRKEKVKPLPKTASQEAAEIEENENIDLAKIFAEDADTDTPEPGIPADEDIVTSAEIDLMVEKSRLEREPIMVEPEEDEPEESVSELARDFVRESVRPEPQMPAYTFPPINLLSCNRDTQNKDLSGEIQQTATKLVETLRSFNVKTKIINVSRGPTITRYELQPEVGTKVRSILNLVDDIALHLATSGVRIEAPIPGKEAVGIEVPNRTTSTVYIRELLEDPAFKNAQSRVTIGLGMDVAGSPVFMDVAKMPHLLIAGTTGSGKSVCINTLIMSILYKARPDEVKFIMIDPKKVELNVYNGLPHLIVPVVSDPKKAAGSLHWAVTEMERRYELIEGAGVRNLKGYNQSIANDPDAEKLPQIVIIIDELADLMMMARDDVEEAICRIAQKARAAGMHLVIGTQRPSVDVVTGLIKANVPSRIAFTTANQVDSRTIIDTVGAEKLIGRGDMLYAPIGSVKPLRVQGCFVSDDEVEEVTTFIKNNYGVRDYDHSVMESIEREAQLCGNKKATVSGDGDIEANDGDPMLKPAISLAVEAGKISTSLIQRRL
ncbi:MAG: DUF87 domain-containing protein, partial [Ruminococcaceae bacterium]|nr:DUF87 domain-containing protein [Oscillospiraceae bacterium]